MLPERPNVLIVEGEDDKYCVVELMAAHIPWPDDKLKAPVHISAGNGVQEILADDLLSTYLKSSPVKRLGVMIDADANAAGRFQRLRDLCLPSFPNLPAALPAEGLVVEHDGKKLGFWIMPDNAAAGYLEGFLRHLVPDQQDELWKHAVSSVKEAQELKAPLTAAQIDKANLHTWLAWQDPPGQTFGRALLRKSLDPTCKYAEPFVAWFRKLFDL
jgi:hypothetical protein